MATSSKRGFIKLDPDGGPASSNNSNISRYNLSISLQQHELQRMLNTTTHSFLGDSTFGGDVMSEHSVMFDGNPEKLQQHVFREKADSLFSQFFDILQIHTSEAEVFDTIIDLIQVCDSVVEETQKELLRVGGGNRQLKRRMNTTKWLEQETKTWKLLHALYKDRVMIQAEGVGMDNEMPLLGASEKEVVTQLYTINDTLREYQLIVDWLEACYERPDIGALVGHSTDRTVGWENTLFQLKSKREIAFSSGAEIVQSMDPDAPTRERRPLHALDEEDNLRLSKCIFNEIRQGHIDEAMALCKYCGQTWRAAILEGWRVHEDPNYDGANQNAREKLPIEGNPRRDIWKKCAWMMADSSKFDDYTRAIAGAFCGHLESMKNLLHNSWEDLLWAYLKVQIDIRVEQEIRSSCIKSYYQMPDSYWNGKMSLEQIFDELAVHKDASVRDQATSNIGLIQKYLMLDNVEELLAQMDSWANGRRAGESNATPASPHMLRFFAHLVLFLRQIGRVDRENLADRIIAAYVEYLITIGDAQLLAFYAAALPTGLQIELYSKFLEGIYETAARSEALEQARRVGLDVENITRHTVESIRQRLPSEMDGSIQEPLQSGDISPFDLRKIQALEWLKFMPEQRGELIWQADAIIRHFLGEGKIECVRATYDIVPIDSIARLINIYGSEDNLPCREACAIKEFLCYKVYLVALESFNDWSHAYHTRPKEPPTIHADGNFTERVASEHKEQAYLAELDRWKKGFDEQASMTRDALFNVLLFPENGWLTDPDYDRRPQNVLAADWENRQIQLKQLRSICIPEVVLLLHKVLELSEDYMGSVRLADEIASESRQLYGVYPKHKLRELLTKLAETSLKLLNKQLDPWGYPMTA